MNRTNHVWQDVAAILQDAGWQTFHEGEQGTSSLPPKRNDSRLYPRLQMGAIFAIVACVLAFLFVGKSYQRDLPDKRVSVLQDDIARLQEQVNSLQQKQGDHGKALRDSKSSIVETMKQVEEASSIVAKMQLSIKDLQRDERRVKAALEVTAKALQELKTDLRGAIAAQDERLKMEHDQRVAAIEALKKRLNSKPTKHETEADVKKMIEGRWKLVAVEKEGDKVLEVKDVFFVFNSGKLTIQQGLKEDGGGEYSISISDGPSAITFEGVKGSASMKRARLDLSMVSDGVFEIGGRDLMKMVLAPSGQRSKDFSTRGHPRHVLFIFHKEG